MTVGRSVLIVDDDRDLSSLLTQLMSREGWHADTAGCAQDGRARLARALPDVVILDVMLPDASGFDLCREWRASHPMLGILMLTARGDPMDRIVGLELGADDYLAKPFEMRELVARVRALLRRQSAALPGSASELRAGALRLDMNRREATVDGRALALSGLEFKLLAELVRAQGAVLSRERLSALIQSTGYQPLERTVDVQVARLRRRLEAALPGSDCIRTVRGEGYAFAPPHVRPD